MLSDNGHIQHFGNAFVLEFYLQNVLLEFLAVAAFAGQVNIGHKLHFDLHLAFALAHFAAAAFYVEEKCDGLKPRALARGWSAKSVRMAS
jgi:hypothetical protein